MIPEVVEIKNIRNYLKNCLNIDQDKLNLVVEFLRLYRYLVLFSFLDVLTTAIAIRRGYSERMFFTRFFIDNWGYMGIVYSKIIILLYLLPVL